MASRGSTRLSQSHAGLIDVDKLDAGLGSFAVPEEDHLCRFGVHLTDSG